MPSRRRLSVLAFALPAWIVMILAGGEWCLMPGSASARLVAERGGRAAEGVASGTHDMRSAPDWRGAPDGYAMQLADRGSASHAGDAHAVDAHAVDAHAVEASAEGAPNPAQHESHHSGDSRTCTSPAACSVAVATARWTLAGARTHAQRPLRARIDRPTSIALAPELPPPRA